MEQIEPDVQPLGGPDPRRCAECNRVLVGRRADATWCTARCRMRWKRKQNRLAQAKASYLTVHPDVSLTDAYGKAGPPRGLVQGDEDFVVPADVVPDEFGMTDGLLDDEPNASWAMRVQMDQETAAVRARYAAEIQHWQSVYRRNPGPAPKLTEIQRRMTAEIAEVERRYYMAEALELAAADQASGRAQARAQERQRELVNMRDFGRDIRGARFEPVRVSRPTSEIFTFGGRPGQVFGSDAEVYRKSGVARQMHNSNPYASDGFVY